MNVTLEVWKPIAGFPGYEVSDLGRVRSLDRCLYNNGLQKNVVRKGCVLKSRPDKDGYRLVTIYNEQGVAHFKVHRLVASHFIENPLLLPEVNHGDFDKANNTLANLCWSTKQNNIDHATGAGRVGGKGKPVVGKKDGLAVVSFSSVSEAARRGFNRNLIHGVLRGASPAHRGLKWEYTT